MRMNDVLDRWAEEGGRRGAMRRILRALKNTGDFWEVVALSEETVPEVARAIDFLGSQGLVAVEDDVIKWKVDISGELDAIPDNLCPRCGGRGVLPRAYVGLVDRFVKIARDRPGVKRDYDQASMNAESVWARVAFIEMRDSLKGSRILIIGDDDLTSIALGFTGKPERITVVEIDPELTAFIEGVAERESLPIETVTLDIREPLPEDLKRSFDIFSTEPSETLDALKVFVGRGISALKGEGASGYVGLTRREASLPKWQAFERMLLDDFSVVITDVVRNFTEYTHWGYFEETRAFSLTPVRTLPKRPWYHSYLIRFELLDTSRGFEEVYTEDFYSDEESSTT
ncbi:MAG: putative methyltransferase [Thermoplasmata archaeon]|nr:MAG: putative methyltransferase [Thermoplasmata archaeon]